MKMVAAILHFGHVGKVIDGDFWGVIKGTLL